MTLIYIGLTMVVLCLIFDEVLPRLKHPVYFRYLIKIFTFEKVIPSLQRNLSDINELKETLKTHIKNKYEFFSISHDQIFFREVQFDYSVSRYSVCPIHGAIELVNPQKVKITFCLNLTIPTFLIFVCLVLFFRIPQANMIWLVLLFLLGSCFWYYILIKKRINILIEIITRWLTKPATSRI